MKKMKSNQLIPIASIFIGFIFIFLGFTKFGFWNENIGPLPGFVPTIIAILLVCVSVIAFIQSFNAESAGFNRESLFAVIGCAAIIGATFLIGMIPSLFLYVILWLRLLEKTAWKQTFIITAIIMSIVIGVFVLWLNVSFPAGLIYDLILG